jgi:phage tail-like protein
MADVDLRYPFVAFNFGVEITMPGVGSPLCGASFSECDGLEISMELKTIREGGNNGRQIRLSGPASFGTLILKRGVTRDTDLWDWFNDSLNDPALRANAEVVMFSSAAGAYSEQKRFILEACVPIKVKAPALNAKDGLIAIEEMQIAYERLYLKKPQTPKPPQENNG